MRRRKTTSPAQTTKTSSPAGAIFSTRRPALGEGARNGVHVQARTADGAPADPPAFQTVAPLWRAGDTIPLGYKTLRVVEVPDGDPDEAPVLVVEEVSERASRAAVGRGVASSWGRGLSGGSARRSARRSASPRSPALLLSSRSAHCRPRELRSQSLGGRSRRIQPRISPFARTVCGRSSASTLDLWSSPDHDEPAQAAAMAAAPGSHQGRGRDLCGRSFRWLCWRGLWRWWWL
jgi:hypothetical protein